MRTRACTGHSLVSASLAHRRQVCSTPVCADLRVFSRISMYAPKCDSVRGIKGKLGDSEPTLTWNDLNTCKLKGNHLLNPKQHQPCKKVGCLVEYPSEIWLWLWAGCATCTMDLHSEQPPTCSPQASECYPCSSHRAGAYLHAWVHVQTARPHPTLPSSFRAQSWILTQLELGSEGHDCSEVTTTEEKRETGKNLPNTSSFITTPLSDTFIGSTMPIPVTQCCTGWNSSGKLVAKSLDAHILVWKWVWKTYSFAFIPLAFLTTLLRNELTDIIRGLVCDHSWVLAGVALLMKDDVRLDDSCGKKISPDNE